MFQALTNEELDIKSLEANRIIVNIWTSGFNQKTPGETVGHVSVQTPRNYMSLWPKQAHHPFEQSALDSEPGGIVRPVTHELPDYDTDLKYENRPPEKVFCFYKLDVTAIEREFDTVKSTLKGWSLLGVCENCESCVSLAYRLLQAGGIEKLAGGKVAHAADQSSVAATGSSTGMFNKKANLSTTSGYAISSQSDAAKAALDEAKGASVYSVEMGAGLVIKSPDFLGEILIKAKQQELTQYPLTQQIKYERETAVSMPSSSSDESPQCCMM